MCTNLFDFYSYPVKESGPNKGGSFFHYQFITDYAQLKNKYPFEIPETEFVCG